MSEKVKTILFAAVALVLAVGAWLAVPGTHESELFDDQGESFYGAFDAPETTSVEIVSCDDARGEPKLFKVQMHGGRWTIPSHEDYPADAERRLGQTAGVVNGLRKGVLRSDRKADFDGFGVGDPLDAERVGPGAGTRVILKDASGKVLSDLIIGKSVEGRRGEHYVRRPDSSRTYACQIDAQQISTRFADWVETDLLKLRTDQVNRIVLDNYRVDEETRAKVEGETLTVAKDDNGTWSLAGGVGDAEQFDTAKGDDVVRTLTNLRLVGVRRKPEGLLELLKRIKAGKAIRQDEILKLHDLQAIGFYLSRDPDSGSIDVVSNEGEMRVTCRDGVVYTLYFGEVLWGEPEDISGKGATAEAAEGEKKDEKDETDKGAEHRYAMIDAAFDASLLGTPPEKPAETPTAELPEDQKKKAEDEYKKAVETYETELKAYEERVKTGRERADGLRQRFADWYYVISGGDFRALHLSRKDLVKPKEAPKAPETAGETPDAPGAPGEAPPVRPAP